MTTRFATSSALILCAFLILLGCEREKREFRSNPKLNAAEANRPVTSIAPGGRGVELERSPKGRSYIGNAYHLAEGKRLYASFNCNGCHANGGGGSGPALMDEKWIYGGEVENIHDTIRDGRPRGMPSFGAMIPDGQIWEIAAYVYSMSGRASSAAAPGRNDSMMPHPAENRLPGAASSGKSP